MANPVRMVEAAKVALEIGGKTLSDRDLSHLTYAYKVFMLVCVDLEYYQPVAPKKIIGSMSQLRDITRLVRLQDHLLSVIRNYTMIDDAVVEEACLGFILPTVRAYLKRHRVKYFRTLNTIAQFLKNLQLRDLETENLAEFQEFQLHDDEINESLAHQIGELLPRVSKVEPKHFGFGPGASYEVSRHKGAGMKIQHIESEPCSFETYRLLASLGFPFTDESWWTNETQCSRAICVPKSIKTRRVITCEPTWNTLASQALRDVLVEYIDQTGFHIFLEDQSFNRTLALAGSQNGFFATIDCHAASDSVTTRLVSILFEDTGLLPYLLDARVPQCEIEGAKVQLRSYAGMGNAVTFPVESLVFAAVCEYVFKRVAPNLVNRPKKIRKIYFVYGDDIVVPAYLYKYVTRILEELGFVINHDKSFAGPIPFRESCGLEALGGHDVSPIRVPRQAYFCRSNTSVMSLMSFSNRLYERGLHLAATAVRQWFKLKDRGLPYVDDPNEYGMFIWSKPDNRHLKMRYNRNLQRLEMRVRDFSDRVTNGPDDFRYQMWLMRHWGSGDKIPLYQKGDGLPDIIEMVRVGPQIAMPRWRYIPTAV